MQHQVQCSDTRKRARCPNAGLSKAIFMLFPSAKAAAIHQLDNNVNQLTISFDLVSDATSAGIIHEND